MGSLWYQPQNGIRERDAAIKFGFELRVEGRATKGNVLSSLSIVMSDKFYWWIQHDHIEYMDVLQKVFITIMNLIVTLKRSITYYLQYRAKKNVKSLAFLMTEKWLVFWLTVQGVTNS